MAAAAVASPVTLGPDPRADFPAWLAAQGMKLPFAQAMERELGIGDYEDLLACAEDTQVTLELMDTARQRLPFALYAALRRVVKAASVAGGPAGSNGARAEWPLHGGAQPGLAALLDAIVATLQTVGQELLQSALRFSRLNYALQGTGSEAAGSPETRREDSGTVLLWPSDDAAAFAEEEEEAAEEGEQRRLLVCKSEVVDSALDAECSETGDVKAAAGYAGGLGCSALNDGDGIYIAQGRWNHSKQEPPNHTYKDELSEDKLDMEPPASPWQKPPPPCLKMSPDGGVALYHKYPDELYELDGRAAAPPPHFQPYQPYQQHQQHQEHAREAPQGLPDHAPHQLLLIPGQRVRDCEVCGKNRRVPGGRKRTRHWCPGCNVGVHEACFPTLVHFHRENRRGRKPQHGYNFPRSPMAAAVQ